MAALGDLLRLAALQASWNRRGMQELGWFVVAEAQLGSAGGTERRRRWLGFRNSNPYVAGLAIGAGIRAERDGQPEQVSTLLDALSRQLGALGDALVWMGLSPLLTFVAVATGLFWDPRAAWIAWGCFALGVAAGLRLWSFRRGLQGAAPVLELLESAGLHAGIRWTRRLAAGSFLLAAAAILLRIGAEWGGLAAGFAMGALCAWRRWPIELCLLGLAGLLWILAVV